MNTTTFYSYDEDLHTNTSAEIIVTHVMNLLHPTSVSDFGCGKGQFLNAFKNSGVSTVHGYDGPWAKEPSRENLDEQEFTCVDFEQAAQIHPQKTDVALSLEVAEHLSATSARDFIRLLCESSDVIIFSAALPLQGGQGHINEQPLSYWSDLFKTEGYMPFDLLRYILWDDDNIEVWYRQNLCIFVKASSIAEDTLSHASDSYLQKSETDMIRHPKTIVHPSFFEMRAKEYEDRLDLIYNGGIKPTSYLYLCAKSIARKIKRGANA